MFGCTTNIAAWAVSAGSRGRKLRRGKCSRRPADQAAASRNRSRNSHRRGVRRTRPCRSVNRARCCRASRRARSPVPVCSCCRSARRAFRRSTTPSIIDRVAQSYSATTALLAATASSRRPWYSGVYTGGPRRNAAQLAITRAGGPGMPTGLHPRHDGARAHLTPSYRCARSCRRDRSPTPCSVE
jgi:hypothetical protein